MILGAHSLKDQHATSVLPRIVHPVESRMTDTEDGPTFHSSGHPTRREVIAAGAVVPVAMALAPGAAAQSPAVAASSEPVAVSLTVNGKQHVVTIDPRTTLL